MEDHQHHARGAERGSELDAIIPIRPAQPGTRDAPSSLVAHLDAILRAADIETVWALTCGYMRELGFNGVIYGYSPTSKGAELGPREDFLLLSTLDRAFMSNLVDSNIYRESVTFNWALRNAGVASWSMTPNEGEMPPDFRTSPEAEAFFERFGMVIGCTVGFPSARSRGRGVMALMARRGLSQSDVDGLLRDRGDELFVVATVAHRSLSTMPYLGQNRSLSPRQREVLEWVAEGKSVADIAAILGLAQPTVEKHLRLAREALGVETTAHALIKAAFLNQMFVVGPKDS